MTNRSGFCRGPLFLLLCFLGTLASVPVHAFVVNDIRVDGLRRVSAGTVFSEFPVGVGEEITEEKLVRATRTLFRTGLFTDIALYREDDVLVLTVEERPSISKITIDGNKDVSEEDLLEGLKSAGMAEGKVFKRVTLERLELEILRSYVAQGRYNASVEASVTELPRNRVEINIKIAEGKVASIVHVNFIGNETFSDQTLSDLMELKSTGFWSMFSGNDKYSKEKLSGDLERIRSHYLDNGHIKFINESTQVSISPRKEDVFITINIDEGPRFTVREFDLKGDLVLDEDLLRRLVILEPGDVFSQEKITFSSDMIARALGSEGFTYANVNAIPTPHEDNTASVTFYIDPGKRTYVRRINFRGNVSTRDEVLRQELVQQEGASASDELIETSKTRLERLGFFSTVNVDTPPVPGVSDQIDVNYTVEEQSSGNLSASLGYSQNSGFNLGLSVSENNFFGSGKRVSFGVNTSSSRKSANFSYLNPYYTVDGVSRGFSIFGRETDFDEQDVSDFVLDEIGGSVTFGYPISNIARLNFGLGISETKINAGSAQPLEITRFIQDEGNEFLSYTLTGGWTRSTLNRGVFPTAGWRQGVSIDLTLPASDLSYYKVSYNSNFYYPLDKLQQWVFRLRTDLAWADGYGETKALPFYEHYYAGGISSVRGYQASSLGRKSEPAQVGDDKDPFGGNLLVENSLELIMPMPYLKDQKSMRLSWFLDSGNVFDTYRGYDFDADELRLATGIGFQWLTFLGPLGFSFGKAINDVDGDDPQFFQFSLGQAL
jgi:outer membrane protein insertion porin family